MSYRVPMQARTSKAKLLLIGLYMLLLLVFAGMDMAVNSYWGKELSPELELFIQPMKGFLSSLGELNVPDYWILYFQSMVFFFFLLFLLPFILTRQKRWLVFALGMALIAVPFEDYMAQLMDGNVIPQWEGPVKLGFTLGLPTFYWLTAIPGALILFLWTFHEIRMYRTGRQLIKTIRPNNHPLTRRGTPARGRYRPYKPRSNTLKRK